MLAAVPLRAWTTQRWHVHAIKDTTTLVSLDWVRAEWIRRRHHCHLNLQHAGAAVTDLCDLQLDACAVTLAHLFAQNAKCGMALHSPGATTPKRVFWLTRA
jgi:hypothetical protein